MATFLSLAICEPKARAGHASFRIGRYMYIWAGTGCRTDVVERLNLSTFTYEQRHLTDAYVPVPVSLCAAELRRCEVKVRWQRSCP